MMPNIEYALASGQSLRHLDVAPMISALRFQPSDFEYAHGWLNHVPSRHRFQFDRKGRVTIDALCGCATLAIKPEQADELHSVFKVWRQDYWLPLETNREFASPFAEPNARLGGAPAGKRTRSPPPPTCFRRLRQRNSWRPRNLGPRAAQVGART